MDNCYSNDHFMNFQIILVMIMMKWNCVRSTNFNTQSVNEHLTYKYDIHFNFFLTKPINEIIYNHTSSTTTIDFKDAILYADFNQYLKRYYFLKNALDKDEIFDRINLLAQFYGNSVLLRYQYPLMILTRTKGIFLKRIKRLKKYLVQEGSSDESASKSQNKVVSINSSRFLRTISSSQLQRKSLIDMTNFQLNLSIFQEDELQTHDIFEQNDENEEIQNSLFLANITRFSKQITQELVLQPQQNEEELGHLMTDFDEFDKEDVLKKYKKIIEKENTSSKQSSRRDISMKGSRQFHQQQPQKIKDLIDKKPMTSSITITALQDQQYQSNANSAHPQSSSFKKKSFISPRMTQMLPQNRPTDINKRSSYFQYELQHNHNHLPRTSQYVIAQDQAQDILNRSKRYRNLNEEQGFENKRSYTPNDMQERWTNNHVKQSAMLNQERNSRFKGLYQQRDTLQRMKPLSYRQPDPKEQYYTDRYHNHLSPQNRLTSINININNLQGKKDEPRVNVKMNKNKYMTKEQYQQEQRNYRAQKKRKIRQKAAALLTRVKSQETMRSGQIEPHQFGESSNNRGYNQRYYRGNDRF